MKTKTFIPVLALAGLLGAALALPETAAADGGWRDRGRGHHDVRDWRHGHRDGRHFWADRYDRGGLHRHWMYRGWYPHNRYGDRNHRHYRPILGPDGSIHLWIVIDD